MKSSVKRWLLAFVMLFAFAGVYAPQQADAARVVVVLGHGHHHRHYYRHHYRR